VSNLAAEIKSWYNQGNIVTRLILINVVIFITFILINVIGKFTNTPLYFIETWFYGTSSLSDFMYRPWGMFTYMFLHSGFRHILFNMLFLYFFGRIFLTFLSSQKFLSIYLLGGIAGFLFYVACYNLFPYFHPQVGMPIVGASAAVMAIMAATVTLAPNYEVRLFLIPFNIRIIWIGLFFFAQDLVALQGSFNIGGSLAHIGGILFGYLAISQRQKGKDITAWFELFLDKITALFTRKHLKVKYTNPTPNRPKTDAEFNLEKRQRQIKIDAILDKIKQSGYDSLSKSEKDFLFNEGKKL
jgi:membrane associated rhomboid family serine protease